MTKPRPPRVSLRKRGGSWYLRFRWDGRRHEAATGTSDPLRARRLAQDKQDELWCRFWGVATDRPTRALTVGELLAYYPIAGKHKPHADRQRLRIETLKAHFGGDEPADGIGSREVQGFVKARLGSGRALTTIRGDIAVLKACFVRAVADGKLAKAPFFERLPCPKAPAKRIPHEDLVKILAHAKVKHATGRWIWLAAFTGLRYRDIIGLRWEQFDWTGKRLRPLVTSKEGVTVYLPLLDPLPLALEPVKKDIGPVFPRPPHPSAVRVATMRACGAAWGCHAFRHTVTSQLAARGLSAPELAALMGHRDPATTLRFYTHLSTAEVEAIRLKIGGSLGEGSEGGAA